MRELRWSDYSVLQKLLYLFENQRNPDQDPLNNTIRGPGAATSMRIENQHHNGGAGTSLNHRTSRLANLDLSHIATDSNFKPNNTAGFNQSALKNENGNNFPQSHFGQHELKEIK